MTGKTAYHLSGSDAFFLALESHGVHESHLDRYCFYLMEIEGQPKPEAISQIINNGIKEQVNAFRLKRKNSLLRPAWDRSNQDQDIPLILLKEEKNVSLNSAYTMLSNRTAHNEKLLMCFYLIQPENAASSILCFKWNHLIMDGQGAYILLKFLFGKQDKPPVYFPSNPAAYFRLIPFYRIVRLISNTSHKPIFFPEKRPVLQTGSLLSVFSFDESISRSIGENAKRCGADTFRSIFFLAVISKSIDESQIWPDKADFWVPVPLNTRKKAGNGPIFSNHLSFYFFRISRKKCTHLMENINDLKMQMKDQARKKFPFVYLKLTEFMRFLPLQFFYIFVKGWKRKQHASFMFTIAHQHDTSFSHVMEHPISDCLSFPPNTDPPGLTFALMYFREELRMMIMSRENILSQVELDKLTGLVRKNLLADD